MTRTPQDRRALLASTAAIGAMFFVNGFAFGSWVPRLPEVRQALDIDDATLGLTLVGAGIGGVVMSVLSGRIVDRLGSRLAVVSTSVVLSLLIPAVALAPSAVVLFAALLAIGAIDGLTDVAQNTQAIEVQGRITRSILTRMHAAWSIGTLLGGLTASWAARTEVSFTVHLVTTAVVLAAVTLAASRWLLPSARRTAHPDDPPAPRVPRGRLVLIFGVGVAAILAEMPPTEWASLLMAERFDLPVGDASLGFVAFATGMVVGRLGGDVLVDRTSSEVARRAGSGLAAAGIVVVSVSPSQPVAWLGLLVAGAGVSALFPLAIRRAAEVTSGSSSGVAAFSSGTRTGALIGAPVMGFLSEATTRTTALLVLAGTAALVSAVVRLPAAPEPG